MESFRKQIASAVPGLHFQQSTILLTSQTAYLYPLINLTAFDNLSVLSRNTFQLHSYTYASVRTTQFSIEPVNYLLETCLNLGCLYMVLIPASVLRDLLLSIYTSLDIVYLTIMGRRKSDGDSFHLILVGYFWVYSPIYT